MNARTFRKAADDDLDGGDPVVARVAQDNASAVALTKSKTEANGAAAKAVLTKMEAVTKGSPAAIVTVNKYHPQASNTYSVASVQKKAAIKVETERSETSTAKTAAKAPAVAVLAPPPPPPSTPPSIQGGSVVTNGGNIVIDVLASDSGYQNKIYWSADNWKTSNYLGVDNQQASTAIGTFPPGTRIELAIDNGQGQTFRTGSPTQNVDGFQHAKLTQNAQGVQVGFEDLLGGGDKDFNDAIVQIRSAPAPEAQNTNRSGLADGTNPGQGAGRVNSPNTGTNNPSQAVAVAANTSTTQAVVAKKSTTTAPAKTAVKKAR